VEVSGQIHAQAALRLGKELLVCLDRRLGGLQSQSGHYEEEKILLEYTGAKKGDSSKNSSYKHRFPNALMLLTTK
jgi:hypothetical protein